MRHLEMFLHVKFSCPNYWHFVHCINVLNWNFIMFIWFAFMLNPCKTICNSFSSLMFKITDEKGFSKCIAKTHLESFANFISELYFSMSTFSACMSVANRIFMPCARILCHVLFLTIFVGFTMNFQMCWCLIKSSAKLFLKILMIILFDSVIVFVMIITMTFTFAFLNALFIYFRINTGFNVSWKFVKITINLFFFIVFEKKKWFSCF